MAQALFRLGISEESAELIAALSPAQVMKLSSASTLLCRFRAGDDLVWSLLAASTATGARTTMSPTACTHSW